MQLTDAEITHIEIEHGDKERKSLSRILDAKAIRLFFIITDVDLDLLVDEEIMASASHRLTEVVRVLYVEFEFVALELNLGPRDDTIATGDPMKVPIKIGDTTEDPRHRFPIR